jgi:hypothetical protein
VTEAGAAIWDSPPTPSFRTALLAAFLKAAPLIHTGGFAHRVADSTHGSAAQQVAAQINAFIASSPALCVPNVTLHVVHDATNTSAELLANLTNTSELVHPDLFTVRFHSFPPTPHIISNDLRWEHFARVLDNEEYDCAFALDLTDIAVFRVPPCGRLPEKLMVASGGNVKPWLATAANRSGLLRMGWPTPAGQVERWENLSR